MPRWGLIGSLAASASVVAGYELMSLSDWAYQQKRMLYEAIDSKGFPFLVDNSSHMYSAASTALSDAKVKCALPSQAFTFADLSRHLFVSCARDGNAITAYGNNLWAIGFPQFFMNDNVDGVKKSAVRLRHSFTYLWARRNKRDDTVHTFERKPLTEAQWNSDAGQDLLKSLVIPSESAVKFFSARQFFLISRYERDAHVNAFIYGSTPCAVYGLVRFFKSTLKNQPMTRGLTLIMYSLATLLVSAGGITTLDFYRCSIERSVDKSAAKLSREYAEGGVQYYNQLLAQNRALRQLQADTGDWKAAQNVSAIGDPITFIRQKSLPLSVRRDICVSLADLSKNVP